MSTDTSQSYLRSVISKIELFKNELNIEDSANIVFYNKLFDHCQKVNDTQLYRLKVDMLSEALKVIKVEINDKYVHDELMDELAVAMYDLIFGIFDEVDAKLNNKLAKECNLIFKDVSLVIP